MKRQILLALVKIGTNPLKESELTEDQRMGVLNDNLAERVIGHPGFLVLSTEGKRVYTALEAVIGVVTKW